MKNKGRVESGRRHASNLTGAGKGRPKGLPNKVTREVRELAGALFDEAYWTRTKERIARGKIAPAIESKLLAYAYGEPKQTINVPQLQDLAAALARKVVDVIEPGPSRSTVALRPYSDQ